MIALDTNILVCARRQELPRHGSARSLVLRLAEGDDAHLAALLRDPFGEDAVHETRVRYRTRRPRSG